METVERNMFVLGEIREQSRTQVARLQRNWGWVMAAGLALTILGGIALGQSAFTTVITVSLLGWMLALGGAVSVIHSFSFLREGFGHFLLHLLAGALYLVAGIMMIGRPAVTALTMTLVLAPLFMVGGVFRVVTSLVLQPPRWGWLTLSGVITTFFGVAIWAGWPSSGLWLIGTYVGIEMIMYGWSTISFALALRDSQPLVTVSRDKSSLRETA